jgi:predicted polyphosphate/ATP-dependent NAD kinase
MPGEAPIDSPRRLGLIVNPIAGMGGRVGLKGTDGPLAARAAELGATPMAEHRARRAVATIACIDPTVRVLAGAGSMGEAVARKCGLDVEVVGDSRDTTTADDTRAVATEIVTRSAELMLFAGGDGTARDVEEAIGHAVPVIGIPTGVKMHSAVFARTPEAAGEIAARCSARPPRAAEVVDLDADGHETLFGSLLVPGAQRHILAAKASAAGAPSAALDAACRSIAAELTSDDLHLLGPGTTVLRVLQHAGLDGTLRGVDAVRAGGLVQADANEAELLALLREHVGVARIVAGVVGGQGSLFGRGNQQLSPEVLRRVGPERITILAAADKLARLDPPCLWVDTGDPAVDELLSGYRHVLVAPGCRFVIRVSA